MKQKENDSNFVPFRRETNAVCRYVFSPGCQRNYDYEDWKEVKFLNSGVKGFDVDNDPFGRVRLSDPNSANSQHDDLLMAMRFVFGFRVRNDWHTCFKE